VRAGHGHHVTAAQHVLRQPLRAAGVGKLGVEHRLQQRVAASDRIADHEEVGRERQLGSVVAPDELDAERSELLAHGWIDVGVAARDAMAGLARERGDASHEGAADAEDVQMHRPILGRHVGAPAAATASFLGRCQFTLRLPRTEVRATGECALPDERRPFA